MYSVGLTVYKSMENVKKFIDANFKIISASLKIFENSIIIKKWSLSNFALIARETRVIE